ncbi:MAG: hypothetical protein KGH97_02880 [Patescibacteria group bacterium]|nr:hypothetical protein [Patescibacteria group bacterium]
MALVEEVHAFFKGMHAELEHNIEHSLCYECYLGLSKHAVQIQFGMHGIITAIVLVREDTTTAARKRFRELRLHGLQGRLRWIENRMPTLFYPFDLRKGNTSEALSWFIQVASVEVMTMENILDFHDLNDAPSVYCAH